MIERTKITVIPEHKCEEKIYIAFDGKEFNSEISCERYEKMLLTEAHPVMKSKRRGVNMDGDSVWFYFIRNDEDYSFIEENIIGSLGGVECDYKKYGAGWYIYFVEEWSDNYPADRYLANWNNYIYNKIKELHKWVDNCNKVMCEGESE